MNQYIYVTSLFDESGKSECIAGLIFAESIVEAMKRLEEFVGETHIVEVRKLAPMEEGPVIEFNSDFIKTLIELKEKYPDLDGFEGLSERFNSDYIKTLKERKKYYSDLERFDKLSGRLEW